MKRFWKDVTTERSEDGRSIELDGRPVSVDPGVAYGMLDGLFQQTLLGYLGGRQTALDSLAAQVRKVMPMMVA